LGHAGFPSTRRSDIESAMYHVLLVAVGGAIGAALRHLTNLASLRLLGPSFPWATMAINIAGSLVMGMFIEMLARRFGASNELRLFVATGILGGFTTFSAFSLDFAVLWGRGAALPALAYALVSVIGALLAVFLGMWLARSVG
jgi:CrcB protein